MFLSLGIIHIFFVSDPLQVLHPVVQDIGIDVVDTRLPLGVGDEGLGDHPVDQPVEFGDPGPLIQGEEAIAVDFAPQHKPPGFLVFDLAGVRHQILDTLGVLFPHCFTVVLPGLGPAPGQQAGVAHRVEPDVLGVTLTLAALLPPPLPTVAITVLPDGGRGAPEEGRALGHAVKPRLLAGGLLGDNDRTLVSLDQVVGHRVAHVVQLGYPLQVVRAVVVAVPVDVVHLRQIFGVGDEVVGHDAV